MAAYLHSAGPHACGPQHVRSLEDEPPAGGDGQSFHFHHLADSAR